MNVIVVNNCCFSIQLMIISVLTSMVFIMAKRLSCHCLHENRLSCSLSVNRSLVLISGIPCNKLYSGTCHVLLPSIMCRKVQNLQGFKMGDSIKTLDQAQQFICDTMSAMPEGTVAVFLPTVQCTNFV